MDVFINFFQKKKRVFIILMALKMLSKSNIDCDIQLNIHNGGPLCFINKCYCDPQIQPSIFGICYTRIDFNISNLEWFSQLNFLYDIFIGKLTFNKQLLLNKINRLVFNFIKKLKTNHLAMIITDPYTDYIIIECHTFNYNFSKYKKTKFNILVKKN